MDEEFLRDLFVSLPDLRIRKLFGGQGVYSSDHIVAVVVDGDLYLKSDAASEPLYESASLKRWSYARQGRAPTRMPYYRMPEAAFDDPDEAARWIAVAEAASKRSTGAKSAKPRGKRSAKDRPA